MSRKCLLDFSANGAKWADDLQRAHYYSHLLRRKNLFSDVSIDLESLYEIVARYTVSCLGLDSGIGHLSLSCAIYLSGYSRTH